MFNQSLTFSYCISVVLSMSLQVSSVRDMHVCMGMKRGQKRVTNG